MASLPCSIASSRRSFVNQPRILLRARGLLTKLSQSWLGPASGFFEVKTSTTSPEFERALERHQAAVDLRTHGAVADLGVHRVGEVDRGRAGGQADDLALRGEDVDLLRADLEAQVVEELPRVGGLGLPVADVREPGHLGVVWLRCRRCDPPPLTRSLYFQCAATPNSARWCISWVRIWISTARPFGPMTVVCSDW